jgi:regulation of enolase protein 1 (concanavalin A-like superfamily)
MDLWGNYGVFCDKRTLQFRTNVRATIMVLSQETYDALYGDQAGIMLR